MAYAELAASYKVYYVQLFEPMAAGRFSGADVRIPDQGIRTLEEFYVNMNTDRLYKHLPIVIYPAYHQRRMGCLASGNHYLYIDPDGCMHPCPFCRSTSKIRIFSQELNQLIEHTKAEMCPMEGAGHLINLKALESIQHQSL
jgi:MoaA/NifB/PqqE/SkfB family radical SAM enzyme